jgi:hypothetical protein
VWREVFKFGRLEDLGSTLIMEILGFDWWQDLSDFSFIRRKVLELMNESNRKYYDFGKISVTWMRWIRVGKLRMV